MRKAKKIEISVPEPCREKWGKMTIKDDGRYCSSCNEIVIDFSKFTDKELIEYLTKKPVACGNFEKTQLNRIMTLPNEGNGSFFQKALFGTALLAGIATNSNGQVNNQPMPMGQLPVPVPVNPNPEKIANNNETIIKGTVIDRRSKKPIQYAYVQLDGTDYEVTTDSSGAFSLHILDSLKGKSISLKCYSSRHKGLLVVLLPNTYPQDLVIALKRQHYF